MKKTKYLLILLAILFTSNLPLSASTTFPDLPTTHWAYQTIGELTTKNITKGYPDGTFKPENTLTRAEFITMLVRALYGDQTATTGEWYTTYVDKAKTEGLFTGFDNYNKVATRAELATLVANALAEKGETIPSDYQKYAELFTDYNQIPTASKEAILKSVATGIITGYPDKTFGATKNITRAESCTLIARIINKSYRTVPKLPSEEQYGTKVPVIEGTPTYQCTEEGDAKNIYNIEPINSDIGTGFQITEYSACYLTIGMPVIEVYKPWSTTGEGRADMTEILIRSWYLDDVEGFESVKKVPAYTMAIFKYYFPNDYMKLYNIVDKYGSTPWDEPVIVKDETMTLDGKKVHIYDGEKYSQNGLFIDIIN